MAITRIYSLVFLVVSVQSQQYGYPYQTGNPYPYPYQTVYNPQNDIVNQQENVSPLNQNYIPYYNSQQPGYYTGYSQNYPYYSFTYPQGHSGQQLQPIPYVYSQSGKPNLPAQYETPQAQPDGGQKFEPIISPTDETKPVDPYANVPTEIIDVDPENFRRIMQHLNAVPTIISYEPRITNGRVRKPHYTVKTESNQYNKTYAPQSILKHQVFSKSYSFNKTYVLHPGQDKNNVINLNFVNGVQVTDAPEDIKKDDDNTVRTTTEITTTTTPESEQPDPIDNWDFH